MRPRFTGKRVRKIQLHLKMGAFRSFRANPGANRKVKKAPRRELRSLFHGVSLGSWVGGRQFCLSCPAPQAGFSAYSWGEILVGILGEILGGSWGDLGGCFL